MSGERGDCYASEMTIRETMETWGCVSLVSAKYIMLEIQREGEP